MRVAGLLAGVALSLLSSVAALPAPEHVVNPQHMARSSLPAVDHEARASLPTVDLGYELHQANHFNSTGRFYNFSNIRYAAPPIGENRWRAPQPPAQNRSVVQTGDVGRICPQAFPLWYLEAEAFVTNYTQGLPFNATLYNESSGGLISPSLLSLLPTDPRTTEDCLFMDVVVPEEIFKNRSHGNGAPVLVWIYGGGYTEGSKDSSYNPAGILARSESINGRGVIFVSFNYRLGAFGWSSGPTFQEDGTANAGLWDQRFALEWVQTHIKKFGGDPKQVTVFGESAGGGSVMHQITAYGGHKGPVPFQRAIPQSPGFFPVPSTYSEETVFQNFLTLLNVSTLAEARKLNTTTLQTANLYQVGLQSPYGTFTYGPSVDGDFVPQLPGLLLAHGQFDKSVDVMVGHNANEGVLFTDPADVSNTAFLNTIKENFPAATDEVAEYMVNTLYPPTYDGSQPYTTPIDRAILSVSESVFTCNTFYLDKAYNNCTYSYLFSVPPALHGQDVAYTFYTGNGATSSSVLNASVAIALQEFITSFAATGKPKSTVAGVPHFKLYGDDANILDLNISSIRESTDPAANWRCDWWQKAQYA